MLICQRNSKICSIRLFYLKYRAEMRIIFFWTIVQSQKNLYWSVYHTQICWRSDEATSLYFVLTVYDLLFHSHFNVFVLEILFLWSFLFKGCFFWDSKVVNKTRCKKCWLCWSSRGIYSLMKQKFILTTSNWNFIILCFGSIYCQNLWMKHTTSDHRCSQQWNWN